MPTTWEQYKAKHPLGSIVEGRVIRRIVPGSFVELEGLDDGIHGFVDILNFRPEGVRIHSIDDYLPVGATIRGIVIGFKDGDYKQVAIGMRQLEESAVGTLTAPPMPEKEI